jgi:hypothetical protein
MPSLAAEPRSALFAAIRTLLTEPNFDSIAEERDALLTRVLAFNAAHVTPYARLVRAHEGASFPAMPTDVFRFTRVAAHAPEHDVRVFRTSGTTNGARGEHAFSDLSLYDLAAEKAAEYALFPDLDGERMTLLILAPSPDEVRDSSLSYMLGRFVEWFGDEHCAFFMKNGELDTDGLARALDAAIARGKPIALLGTSFAFVFADDALGERRFALPEKSRIMQTGGFKGRTREIAPDEMRAMLSSRYGVLDPFIVAEYGMTELSSQLYERTLRDVLEGRGPQRLLWAPPWMRVTPVDPVSLESVSQGERGILRIDDLVNLDSVAAIQTADLGVMHDAGIELLGRSPGAVPRGCSLAIEEALAQGGS